MTSFDLHSYVGAYALDAVTDAERAAFKEHLTGCESCREELQSLRAATAELSQMTVTAPPPQLRTDVLAGIKRARPLPPISDNVIALRRARHGRTLWQGLAAACAVLALILGGWGYQQHQDARGRSAVASQSAFDQVLNASDARTVTHSVGANGSATLVYSASQGRVALVGHGLSTPGAAKVYQLWLLQTGQPAASKGTFAPDASGNVSYAASGDVANAVSMGISIEPAGGSKQPTNIVGIVPL